MSEISRTHNQILRFALVCSVSLLIDWSVYSLSSNALGIDSSWAKRASFACIVLWGFLAHRRFTFRQQQFHSSEPIKFACLYIAGLILNSFVHDLAANGSAASTSAFLVATFAWACLNFTAQKFFVFTDAKRQRETTGDS